MLMPVHSLWLLLLLLPSNYDHSHEVSVVAMRLRLKCISENVHKVFSSSVTFLPVFEQIKCCGHKTTHRKNTILSRLHVLEHEKLRCYCDLKNDAKKIARLNFQQHFLKITASLNLKVKREGLKNFLSISKLVLHITCKQSNAFHHSPSSSSCAVDDDDLRTLLHSSALLL
jgi:hypothetical protein